MEKELPAHMRVKYCQAPSRVYARILEENFDDPRSAAAQWVNERSGSMAQLGWQPDPESREAK